MVPNAKRGAELRLNFAADGVDVVVHGHQSETSGGVNRGSRPSLRWLAGCGVLVWGCNHGLSTPAAARGPTLGCAAARVPCAELKLEAAYRVAAIGEFEPSGLVWYRGRLLTVTDEVDDTVFELRIEQGVARVVPAFQFQAPGVGPFTRLDLEGLAVAADGALLIVSEATSRVLRVDPRSGQASWLALDVEAVARSAGLLHTSNAGFEGIAALPNGGLLLAAEREPRGFVEVPVSDLHAPARAWVLPASAYAMPKGRAPDFADLASDEGQLYALARGAHFIARLDATYAETELWSYAATENDPQFAYESMRYGRAEGLAITQAHVYVVLDNNGDCAQTNASARDPWLFVFKRPAP